MIRKMKNFYKIFGFQALIVKIIRTIYSFISVKIKNFRYIFTNTKENKYTKQYNLMLNNSLFLGKEYVPFSEHNSRIDNDKIKLIAFYLPQFHPIPENDEWWGKGFTDWNNVSKATPQFEGHYQPHLPGELGYYDLRVPEIQRRQVELAKNYGIYGFCFHYYWFKGKRLLEHPLEMFIRDPEIDFPFCICWANESWTRRWDGNDNDILIAQEHTPETDINFINDVIPLFKHNNYITINGHPILIIYSPDLMPDLKRTALVWRSKCIEAGLKEPYIIAAQTFGFVDPRKVGCDAAVEFPPHNLNIENHTHKINLLNKDYLGNIFQYSGKSSMSNFYLNIKHSGYNAFKTVAPGWDNEPRRPGKGHTFAFSSPEKYKTWLLGACNIARNNSNPEERIVFINAWNEWGEGAYLEPDRKYGYAYLKATSDAVKSISKTSNISKSKSLILFVLHDANYAGAQVLIKNIINWLDKHTSIIIKLMFLEKGVMLPEYSILGEILILEDFDKLTKEGFLKKVGNFCGRKPDLIYGNTVAVGKIYDYLKIIGSPIVTHIHELEISINRYAWESIDKLCLNSDHFISVSDAVSENLIVNHKVLPETISKVYGGIPDVERKMVVIEEEKKYLRDSLGIPNNKKVIVGCGLGMPFRKGADLFIQVANGIQRMLPGKVQFYWIGDFNSNESDEKFGVWKDYQREIKKEDYIEFLGFQSSPKDFFQIADLFLLTSREDPFPLVVLEAAQCGLPIVCFDNSGGASEFVDKKNGAIVPFANVDDMITSSIKILFNENHRVALGLEAQKKVKRYHTIDVIAPQILSVCHQVSKKKPEVSVIVPNFNHSKYLPERLESIFNQSFRDFEVIILDDASTDNSLEIIRNYSDRVNVQVIRNAKNSGSPFHQWIKGLKNAQSELIWIAESDDKCENNFLEVLLPSFDDCNMKFAYTNSWVINAKGEVTGDYLSTDYLKDLSETNWNTNYKKTGEEEINDGLGIKNTILNISSSIFRKPKFDKLFYDSLNSMKYAGDWFLIVNLIRDGYIYYDARKINYHRRHDESVIGELIKKNKTEEFYKEIASVQKSICSSYSFDSNFLDKWVAYNHKQWNEFFPTRGFKKINEIYPYDEIMNLIKSKSQGK